MSNFGTPITTLAIRTRAHSDVDLVVPLPSPDPALDALAAAGYARVLRDWRPTATAVGDERGREVDLHLVTPTRTAVATRRCRAAARSTTRHRSAALSARGPYAVRGAGVGRRRRTGYLPRPNDLHDVPLLCPRSGIPFPPGF